MFKKHHAEVRFVKDEKPSTEVPVTARIDIPQLAKDSIQNVFAGTTVLVVAYVAADTFRRVIVHTVATKIQ